MTNFKKDSFNLYIIFYQSKSNPKTFVIESFISWRWDDTLRRHLKDISDDYGINLNIKLLLKIDTTVDGKEPNFDICRDFEKNELMDFNVMREMYQIDEEILIKKIFTFFNSRQISYISIWGDWEDLFNGKFDPINDSI